MPGYLGGCPGAAGVCWILLILLIWCWLPSLGEISGYGVDTTYGKLCLEMINQAWQHVSELTGNGGLPSRKFEIGQLVNQSLLACDEEEANMADTAVPNVVVSLG